MGEERPVVAATQTTTAGSFRSSYEYRNIGIELTVDPVAFASLTAFDWTGFSGQWIRASVDFTGITLYTQGQFDYGGVVDVTFGFEFRF